MKKAIAEKWVKALRSGKYKQTTAALRDKKGYCCLGVLCDLSKQGAFDDRNHYIRPRCRGSSTSLPVFVQRELANRQLISTGIRQYLPSSPLGKS